MTNRKSISKTVRFEVFKRDAFTCQYCGAKAPEVILHCDHINPVALGGQNDILNLVTACSDCNGGKGARRIDDRSVVNRQRAQIEELELRREQLQMMLDWRDAAQAAVVDEVEEMAIRMEDRGHFRPNASGLADIRKWLRRYSIDELVIALDIAFDQYMRFDGDEPNDEAWHLAFTKIPAIAGVRRSEVEKPYLRQLMYIQGIMRNRFGNKRVSYLADLEDAHADKGWPIEEMERAAKAATSWGDFIDRLNALNGDADGG